MIRLIYRIAIMAVCLFAGANMTYGQAIQFNSSPTIRLPQQGTWRFHAGDSIGWANPGYNAQRWPKRSPQLNLMENAALWKSGRGWFRKTIRFHTPTSDSITMTIRQFGTSEVYLDGKRVATLRPAHFDKDGSQRIIAFVPLQIADTSQHVLAVRYAFRRDPLYGSSIHKAPFQLEFQLSDRAATELVYGQASSAALEYLIVGVFGVLSLLHLLFYRANTTQPVNLLLSLTMLAFSLIFLIDRLEGEAGTLTVDSLLVSVLWILVNVAMGLLLVSVYTYLNRRLNWLFWGIIAVLTTLVVYSTFVGPIPGSIVWLPFVLVIIDYIRVSWLARRHSSDPAARLLWNSLKFSLYAMLALIGLVLVMVLISQSSKNEDNLEWIAVPVIILSLVSLFSVPIGLSFSLVGDYARTYQSLRHQLDLVNRLSAQSLAQEQEKQQLLASQNVVLELQVADRTAELNRSLSELRETQTQLIQREKLASLGELTAGIAHEIQNPLNFVTNFSEVSTELVVELEEEQQKASRDADLEAELLGDLKQNLQKITHHGGRASAIVKGMLEHSRTGTGTKQLTDLNALADEYLKIAYHGLRAKNPSFNAQLVTDFQHEPAEVEVVPQDMGRVLLNLYNNAFYAVWQKQKTAGPDYKPTVWVRIGHYITERTPIQNRMSIILEVRDNGTGIPESVEAKIFQPFFTTKPTGEGTGLGLSLSYDIITKGHGGTLSVESEEGEGSTFFVTLPGRSS